MKMGKVLRGLVAVALLSGTAPGYAQPGCVTDRHGNVQCGPAGGRCIKDVNGEVKCSPSGGSVMLDRYRNAVCGPGRCLVDRHGDVVCSRVAKGAAAINVNGDPVCASGCVTASAAACITPSK
jgi:hypothetical protein